MVHRPPANQVAHRGTEAGGVPGDIESAPWGARVLRRDWAGLAAAQAEHARFGPDLVAGLPEPVRRWLTGAVALGPRCGDR